MLLRIKFRIKKSVNAHVYHPQEWSYRAQKIDKFQVLYLNGKADSILG